jgi:uncharacterized protein (DUF1015 family)
MSKIVPFKAIRPVRDKAHLVASRPLFTYKKNVLDAKLEDNPYTFLHIIHPENGSDRSGLPQSPERFQLVREGYRHFLDAGILIQDKTPHFYIYRQRTPTNEFTGIIAGASIEEYEKGLIKKHEATLTSREKMFTDYLDIVGYNAEPVLLSHESLAEINDFLSEQTGIRPEYEFTTTDCITHELWVVDDSVSAQIQLLYNKLEAVYIADGHHRSASSAGLKKKRTTQSPRVSHENENYFLAFFIDEAQLEILEFNRLITGLNQLTIEAFIQQLEQVFEVEKLQTAGKPSKEHEMTMCLRGEWFKLNWLKLMETSDNPVAMLDAEMLTQKVLTPILGIEDLKTDKRVQFVSGAEGLEVIETNVLNGAADVGFVLFPINIHQVKSVADHNLIMPPKSTWVEPKLRSGLTIYSINE